MAAEKILTVLAAKDRLIASQSLVMDLAREVVCKKDVKSAVRTLVQAVCKVVDADRVALFLVEDDALVCHMSPDPDDIGRRLPMGCGIVGHVCKIGATVNLEDAYTRPDVFDISEDLLTEYTTRSVLCSPLCDNDGKVIGVLEAINKHGPDDHPVPFEKHDERSLELFLALTAQQLRVTELVVQRDKAVKRAESMLHLVEAMSAERDIDGVATALGRAAVGLLHCRWALVFLKDFENAESGVLVCHAAVPGSSMYFGEKGLRVEANEAVLGEVAASGRPILLDKETNTKELANLHQRLMPCFGDEIQMEAHSLLCAPLPDTETGEVLGVVVAIDRLVSLGDIEDEESGLYPKPPSPETPEGARPKMGGPFQRRFSAVTAMRTILKSGDGSGRLFTPSAEAGQFSQADADTVGVLSHSAANILRTAELYSRELRLNQQMGALVGLITESRRLGEDKHPAALVAHVSHEGRKIFDCDRCTFWTVDTFDEHLVGFYVISCMDGQVGQKTLHELRVPKKGIVGHVATTREPLNITDAWNDERFSNAMDLKTGYRTRSILCAPVVATNGRLVGILQCINKNGGRAFGADDMEMLNMVSISVSDIIQQAVVSNSYESFIKGNKNISSEVKDMFCFFEQGSKNAQPAKDSASILKSAKKRVSAIVRLGLLKGKAQKPLVPTHFRRSRSTTALLDLLERWDFDLEPMGQDNDMVMKGFRMASDRLGLGDIFETVLERTGPFIKAIQSRYRNVPYHSWSHAVATWHAAFLLLDSPAFNGLLLPEDVLALLLAAFGHDVEHPGTSNNFQVNSASILALRYNDISVLENHHAAVTCIILKEEQVLDGLEQPIRHRIRQVLVNSILHTDMIKHREILTWMETCNADLLGHRKSSQTLDHDVGLKLGSALLHCSDLVHPAKPWQVHKRMSTLIAMEFYAQHTDEQRMGLPTLPFMGHDPGKLRELAPIQIGFLQFVAKPLWSALCFVAGEGMMDEVQMNVEDNRERWQRLADGEDVPDEQPFRMPKQRALTPTPE